MKLSIIIPVYNEKLLLGEIITRCRRAVLPPAFSEREIVVVDDGSSDGTTELLKSLGDIPELKVHHSYVNHGKGCAVRVGLKLCTGDVVIIQDGDLEYDPMVNYPILLASFVNNPTTRVVFGSRFLKTRWPEGMHFFNLVANYILTWTVRLLYGSPITDEATGYKVFRPEVLKQFSLHSRGFEFCPEFTAKVLRAGIPIIEVEIQYHGRRTFEGKKIKLQDGFIALATLIKWRFRPIKK
ncbi:MAG: glycosyltransferase family 2 protein [Candidatus Omnitrophica bacterium]|nr:glycosyltransferase family 2 protein [Candidatus Omnitrophota bacterium]